VLFIGILLANCLIASPDWLLVYNFRICSCGLEFTEMSPGIICGKLINGNKGLVGKWKFTHDLDDRIKSLRKGKGWKNFQPITIISPPPIWWDSKDGK